MFQFILKFVGLFILLSSVDPFLVFECCFSISLHNIISLFITERQVPPQISMKSPPPLDVQTNSPSSTMDWMTIIILVFILLCLLFGCLCIFLKKCGILGNRCPLCRNWLSQDQLALGYIFSASSTMDWHEVLISTREIYFSIVSSRMFLFNLYITAMISTYFNMNTFI